MRSVNQDHSDCIKGANEYVTRVDSSAPLKYHDLNNHGCLILIQINPNDFAMDVESKYPLLYFFPGGGGGVMGRGGHLQTVTRNDYE